MYPVQVLHLGLKEQVVLHWANGLMSCFSRKTTLPGCTENCSIIEKYTTIPPLSAQTHTLKCLCSFALMQTNTPQRAGTRWFPWKRECEIRVGRGFHRTSRSHMTAVNKAAFVVNVDLFLRKHFYSLFIQMNRADSQF